MNSLLATNTEGTRLTPQPRTPNTEGILHQLVEGGDRLWSDSFGTRNLLCFCTTYVRTYSRSPKNHTQNLDGQKEQILLLYLLYWKLEVTNYSCHQVTRQLHC